MCARDTPSPAGKALTHVPCPPAREATHPNTNTKGGTGRTGQPQEADMTTPC